jgi:phospho-N-acetylmuramoyl-pentapeptide-transferase
MLYNLLVPLAEEFTVFNLFRYLTFRSGGAVITALTICFLIGPRVIDWLRAKQGEGQPIREDGPEGHLLTKKGTPTMGGFLILIALTVSTLLWADLTNRYVWCVLIVTTGFGAVGFIDDYLKLTKRSSDGLPGRLKMLIQVLIATGVALWISFIAPPEMDTHLAVPFLKSLLINLGVFFIPFAVFVMVGASNAVNLTDGLDGLAIVPVMIAAAASP